MVTRAGTRTFFSVNMQPDTGAHMTICRPARIQALCAMALALLLQGGVTSAWGQQRSPIARAGPVPFDLTPQVQLFQCGNFQGHFGPIDFRKLHPQDRRLVEEWHFDAELSMFMRGEMRGRTKAGTTNATSGFQYTLKAIPNHPIALKVMEEAARKLKTEQPSADYPMECWYLRAFMIAPDDPMVRAFYGVYLAHRNRPQEARHNLDIADKGLRNSRTMQYIVGETRLILKDHESAQLNAMRAAQLGYRGDALEKALRAGGHWKDDLVLPDEPPDAEDAATPASAASDSGS